RPHPPPLAGGVGLFFGQARGVHRRRPGRPPDRPHLDFAQRDRVLLESLRPSMNSPCGPWLDRRRFLALAGVSWLTPVGHLLARQAERPTPPPRSLILLGLNGGPSQLEPFAPPPDPRIAAGSKATPTAVKGVRLADGFERLADELGRVALIRSMVSKEG